MSVWYEYTTERNEDSDDERVYEGCEDGVGCICGDKLTKTLAGVSVCWVGGLGGGGTYCVKELIDQHDEEDRTCLVG